MIRVTHFRMSSHVKWVSPELGGHGHELNGHRCPCPRHGHGRGMDTKFLEKRGVDMDSGVHLVRDHVHLTLGETTMQNAENTESHLPMGHDLWPKFGNGLKTFSVTF